MKPHFPCAVGMEQHGEIRHFIIGRLKHNRPLRTDNPLTSFQQLVKRHRIAAHHSPAARRPRRFQIKCLTIQSKISDITRRERLQRGFRKRLPVYAEINRMRQGIVNQSGRTPVAQSAYAVHIPLRHGNQITRRAEFQQPADAICTPSPRFKPTDVKPFQRCHKMRASPEPSRDHLLPAGKLLTVTGIARLRQQYIITFAAHPPHQRRTIACKQRRLTRRREPRAATPQRYIILRAEPKHSFHKPTSSHPLQSIAKLLKKA